MTTEDFCKAAAILFSQELEGVTRIDYNPAQPRDSTGRWTAGGGSGRVKILGGQEEGRQKKTEGENRTNAPDIDKKKVTFVKKEGVKNGQNMGYVTLEGKKYFVKGGMSESELRSEEKAFKIAKETGMDDLFVETKVYNIDGKPYAVSPYLGKEADRKTKEDVLFSDKETARRALLHDYLTGQEDRHMANTFVTQKKEIKLIDNELALGNSLRKYPANRDLEKFDSINIFYIPLSQTGKPFYGSPDSNVFRKNNFVDIVLQIDDMIVARNTAVKEKLPDKDVQRILKNEKAILRASAENGKNNPLVEARMKRLRKIYKPGQTTYGDLIKL